MTIAKALHPEAIAEATGTATPAPDGETADDETPVPETPTPSATPTEPATETPGQPGFGLLIALTAFIGSLLACRVRS